MSGTGIPDRVTSTPADPLPETSPEAVQIAQPGNVDALVKLGLPAEFAQSKTGCRPVCCPPVGRGHNDRDRFCADQVLAERDRAQPGDPALIAVAVPTLTEYLGGLPDERRRHHRARPSG